MWLGVRIGVWNSKGLSCLLEGSAVVKAAWWRAAKESGRTVHSATAVRARPCETDYCHMTRILLLALGDCEQDADRGKSQVGKP